MPLDQETIEFLVQETIDAALEDTKEKLNELVKKYHFTIRVRKPALIAIKMGTKGEIVWE